MKNMEFIKQLEEKNEGLSLDMGFKSKEGHFFASYDSYDLLEFGLKASKLNLEDYEDMNTCEERYSASEIMRPLRNFLNKEVEDGRTDFWDEEVAKGKITLKGVKFEYYILISH